METAVLQAKLPVLLDFWADWCPPCQMISRWLERIAPDYAGKFIIAKVDVTTDRTVADQFEVQSMPTLLWIVNSEVKHRLVEQFNEAELRNLLDSWLGQEKAA